MTAWEDLRSQVILDKGFQLVFGRRRGSKSVIGYRVKCGTDVAQALRDACKATLESLASQPPVELSPDIPSLDRRNTLVPQETEVDPLIIDWLRRHQSLLDLDLAKAGSLVPEFYAVVCDAGEDHWSAFISKANPNLVADGRRFFSRLTRQHDTLVTIEEPLFQFATVFGMVVVKGAIVVSDQRAFELLFRDVGAMRGRYPVWTLHVAKALGLEKRQHDTLTAQCLDSPAVARQVRRLYERKLPISTNAADLKVAMAQQDVDTYGCLDGDEWALEKLKPAQLVEVLKFVNEDFYLGPLSSEPYEAVGKIERREGPRPRGSSLHRGGAA